MTILKNKENTVTITNGVRDNWKTTTPMWCRTITKALLGRRAPTTQEWIEGRRKQDEFYKKTRD